MGRLDIDLDRKSKQHNLTSHNVRAILHVSGSHTTLPAAAVRANLVCMLCGATGSHRVNPHLCQPGEFSSLCLIFRQEVITHERVVAMMKAAIRETQDLPMFVRFQQLNHCNLCLSDVHSEIENKGTEESSGLVCLCPYQTLVLLRFSVCRNRR